MIQSLLFLLVQLAIFWVIYWAWQEDEKDSGQAQDKPAPGRRG